MTGCNPNIRHRWPYVQDIVGSQGQTIIYGQSPKRVSCFFYDRLKGKDIHDENDQFCCLTLWWPYFFPDCPAHWPDMVLHLTLPFYFVMLYHGSKWTDQIIKCQKSLNFAKQLARTNSDEIVIWKGIKVPTGVMSDGIPSGVVSFLHKSDDIASSKEWQVWKTRFSFTN